MERRRSRRSERYPIPAIAFSASEDVLLFDAARKDDAQNSMRHHHSEDTAESARVDDDDDVSRRSTSAHEDEERDDIHDEERGSAIVSIDDGTASSIDILNARSVLDASSESNLRETVDVEMKATVVRESSSETQEQTEEPPRQKDPTAMIVDEMSSFGKRVVDCSVATKCLALLDDPPERHAFWEPSCVVAVKDLQHEGRCIRATGTREATDLRSSVMDAEESEALETPCQREAPTMDTHLDVHQRYPIQTQSLQADNDASDNDDGDVDAGRPFDRLGQLLTLLRRKQVETQVNDL